MYDLRKNSRERLSSLKEAVKETMCPSELDAILDWTEYVIDGGTEVVIRVGRPGRVFTASIMVTGKGYTYRDEKGAKVKVTEPTQTRAAFRRERTVYDETV